MEAVRKLCKLFFFVNTYVMGNLKDKNTYGMHRALPCGKGCYQGLTGYSL